MSKTRRNHPPKQLDPKPREQKRRRQKEAMEQLPLDLPQRLEPVDWKPLG